MTSTDSQAQNWQELDLLRGVAAIMMVVNHAGFKLLSPELFPTTAAQTLLFISSCAPVIFFFVTGVGYGLQSAKKSSTSGWASCINKFLILILADLLIQWSQGHWLGLDFLGFIAVSSLVLECIRRSNAPCIYSVIGLLLTVALRFGVGPLMQGAEEVQRVNAMVNWLLGTKGTSSVSYPCSPWMAYPLFGYLVGVGILRCRSLIESHRNKVIAASITLASGPAMLSGILWQRGASFHRWSTVGIGFFVVSFAVILVCLAAVLWLQGIDRLKVLRRPLSLKGIASLAIVPIHYLLIYLAAIAGVSNLTIAMFVPVICILLWATFMIAKSVEQLSMTVREVSDQTKVWLALVALLVVSAGLTMMLGQSAASLSIYPRTIGQLALCLLFVVRLPFPNRRSELVRSMPIGVQ